MRRARLGLCIGDREYGDRFTSCLMNHYRDQLELHMFSQKEALQENWKTLDAIVLSDDLAGENRIECEIPQIYLFDGNEIRDPDTRKLIFVNEELGLRFFLAKGPDVPTYVEYGAADIGIVGKDTILEESRNIYEVLDLGFGKCKMCICGPESAAELLQHHEQIRVATKYPRIAKDYFYNKKHQTVEIIKLNGSIELAPIVGLSEVICDIVETGTTLRENGLTVLEEVCPLSARVVVNQVSMKMENERITKLIRDLKKVI